MTPPMTKGLPHENGLVVTERGAEAITIVDDQRQFAVSTSSLVLHATRDTPHCSSNV
jgi:hypothetical protein